MDIGTSFPLRDATLYLLYSLVSPLDRFLVPDMSLGSRLLLLPNGEMLGPTEGTLSTLLWP